MPVVCMRQVPALLLNIFADDLYFVLFLLYFWKEFRLNGKTAIER